MEDDLDFEDTNPTTQEFLRAVEYITFAFADLQTKLSNDIQLLLYAHYKQATVGPCNTPKPNFWDLKQKAKWQAWSSLGQQSKSASELEYLKIVTKLNDTWKAKTERNDSSNNNNEDTRTGESNSGPVFSRPQFEEQQTALNDQDLCFFTSVGKADKVKEILQNPDYKGIINVKDKEGRTALHYACDRENTELVQLLLEHNADVNLEDEEGETALHYACLVGNLNIVKKLLEHGAQTSKKNKEGETPIQVAEDESIKSMIQTYKNPNQ